mgnify:CR=1 FL=1
MPYLKLRRNIYAKELFKNDPEPNVRLFQEYRQLFDLQNKGVYYSIYSKVAKTLEVKFTKNTKIEGH